MNRNSLENFRAEAKALKVPQSMIDAAEKEMEKGVANVQLQGQLPADKGTIDVTIHIRQSSQSDFYYFNKFDVALDKSKPLEKDHKYMVTSPSADKPDKNVTRGFDSVIKAMDFFKDQKGAAELSMGKFTDKDMQYRDTLATMKEGKVDYVKNEFRKTFYAPVIRNSHYVDRGKGFSVEQASNMLQGRSVFREDMVSRAGEQYAAWSQYQFNEPKDRYGNYTMKQFSESYGFDLRKELDRYQLKELDGKESAEKLVKALQDGQRPVVTVTGPDGEDRKLRIEAVPRYGNVNFTELDGKPQKREEFLKASELDKGAGREVSQEKRREKSKGQEMGV
ncbi:hypothetical protein [Pedobacter deserti]|uniref:hypothetical protein n=1 Tax=Pedobacter deserti TaxID=2817382 RepID=UPI00210EF1F0|nr:hypothetical protein [Pedobacter sp. SYSU D00382]